MTFYFLIPVVMYAILLLVLRQGWNKALHNKGTPNDNHTDFISVVIPFRNEEENLPALVTSLFNQTFPSAGYEVIFVDDHSTDSSVAQIEQLTTHRAVKSVALGDDFGKKAALTIGIGLAKGNIIVTTDADCTLPADWLRQIHLAYNNPDTLMTVGMITLSEREDFFSAWQTMEMASVIGTGAAALGWDRPLMCNGANLSFRKNIFHEVGGYRGNEHIPSGDDEFLMRKIVRYSSRAVVLLGSPEAVVTTAPQPTLKSFVSQRVRWASKWRANSSLMARLLAVVIFLAQVFWISSWFTTWETWIAIVVVKVTADLIFLLPVFRFMKIRFKVLPFIGLQFFYPFYVVFVGLLAPWASYTWKERYFKTASALAGFLIILMR